MIRKKSFTIDRVPGQFNEGMFWGNGVIGALLYVRENTLRFSIDHTGLWESRDTLEDRPLKTFKEILDNKEKFLSGNPEYVGQTNVFDFAVGRTRLPGLSFTVLLGSAVIGFYGETDLNNGYSTMEILLEGDEEGGQKKLGCFAYIDSCLNVVRVCLKGEGAGKSMLSFKGWDTENPMLKPIKNWNYPRYEELPGKATTHIHQPFSGDGLAVMSILREDKADGLDVMLTLNTGLIAGRTDIQSANEALLHHYRDNEAESRKNHESSWEAFWGTFDVRLPSERLQQAFDLEMFKLFCNERPGGLPVTLQGIWNPDSRMPAWFGDWHNDLNVQACYWPAYKTNHVELVKPYIDYYTACVPRFEERAEKLFGIKNAVHIPVMMGPGGFGAASEWCFWNVLTGPELFVATDFCWYFEYSNDRAALEEKIYPFLCRVARLYQGIAFEGEDGKLHIPFTNSPEIFRDGKMLCHDDGTFVLSVLHYLLKKLALYAGMLGRAEEGQGWAQFDEALVPVATGEKGYPLFPGEEVFESHRHFCHLYPLFPLGNDGHSKTANAALDAVINLGFTEFASFSFPYLAMFASRCARGNMARTMLEIYAMGFRTRNSFVINGDSNANGLFRISDTNAGESSDAFTLEAGFMFASAVCDMFAHRINDTIYVGAGLADDWKSCSCRNITVEGGHRISLQIENYRMVKASIVPGKDETVNIRLFKPEREAVRLTLKKDAILELIEG